MVDDIEVNKLLKVIKSKCKYADQKGKTELTYHFDRTVTSKEVILEVINWLRGEGFMILPHSIHKGDNVITICW